MVIDGPIGRRAGSVAASRRFSLSRTLGHAPFSPGFGRSLIFSPAQGILPQDPRGVDDRIAGRRACPVFSAFQCLVFRAESVEQAAHQAQDYPCFCRNREL
jgi:hypothetical protein